MITESTMKKLRQRWIGMLKRCKSTRPEVARNYAQRGIGVCDEWHHFDTFARYVVEVIGVPSFEGAQRITIDRINNSKGYEPGNIRWATYSENLRNRRCNRIVEYNGEQVTIAELAERYGKKYGLLMDRIARYGWSVDKAVNTPTQHDRRRTVPYRSKAETILELDDRVMPFSMWCKEYQIEPETLRGRLARGWNMADALTKPSDKGSASRNRAERFVYKGQPRTLSELEAITGIKRATLRYRLQILRLPIEHALKLKV